MSDEHAHVRNEIHGGVHGGTIIQGRDITYHAPNPKPVSLRGLPRLPSVFEGREPDVEALLGSLNPDLIGKRGFPAVLVSGMPGLGKTALALQTAKWALDQAGWFDGVLYVDLFGYDPQRRVDPGRVLGWWLSNLGIDDEDIPSDSQEREQVYRAALSSCAQRGRPILVVIDNASSAEQVGPLLPGDGRSGALVTSRQVLDLGIRIHRLGLLDDGNAIEVIRHSLRELGGESDTRVVGEPDEALRLVRLCGHLPLALRIVAGILADMPALPLAQMVSELQERRLDGLEREEMAVRVAFDLSYRNLPAPQTELFQLLALAPGPDVSLESAAVLVDADMAKTRLRLAALVRASLIDPVGADRWRLHDLVRLYASEKAKERDPDEACVPALRRLLRYLMLTADAADDGLEALPGDTILARFSTRERALAWLEAEQETLISAFQTACEVGQTDYVVNLPPILTKFMGYRMRFAELLELAEASCGVAEREGLQSDAAKLRLTLGRSYTDLRRFDQALGAYDRAFAHAVAVNDWQVAAGALDSSGVALRHVGRYEESLGRHTEAALVFERLGDESGLAKTLNNRASVLLKLERPFESIADQRDAVNIQEGRGDLRGVASAYLNMANSYTLLNEHGAAAEAFRLACDGARKVGDLRLLSLASSGLAGSLFQAGLVEDAFRAFEDALGQLDDLGDLYHGARTWRNFGVALRGYGRTKQAEQAFRNGLELFVEFGDLCGEGDCWNDICGLLASENRFAEALAPAHRAVECHEGLVESECMAVAWNNLAFTLLELGRLNEAIPALRRSRDVRAGQGDLRRAAQISRVMGFKLVEAEQYEMSLEPLGEAVRLFFQVGDGKAAEDVREMMEDCAAMVGALREYEDLKHELD